MGSAEGPQYRSDYEALVAEDREEEYKYAGLKHYIDYKRSYPGPDGNIIGAKPLYYGQPKIGLFYTQDYLRSMFSTWHWMGTPNQAPLNAVYSQLELTVIDSRQNNTGVIRELSWSKDSSGRKTDSVRLFNNVMRNVEYGAKACVMVEPIDITPGHGSGTPADAPLPPLDAGTLYTAVLSVRFAEFVHDSMNEPVIPDPDTTSVVREVYRFVFQTSRYTSFEEHIKSYILSSEPGEEAYSIYSREVDSANITVARDYITDPNGTAQEQVDLRKTYALDYDRIVEGGLQLRDLPPADTTEFTVVYDDMGGALGILVRSPEPLNDPRLPLQELETGLIADQASNPLRVYFAKDAGRAFITNDTMTLPAGQVDLTFRYRLFDGSDYNDVQHKNESGTVETIPPVAVQITV